MSRETSANNYCPTHSFRKRKAAGLQRALSLLFYLSVLTPVQVSASYPSLGRGGKLIARPTRSLKAGSLQSSSNNSERQLLDTRGTGYKDDESIRQADSELLSAVWRGDVQGVKRALANGADTETRYNWSGYTDTSGTCKPNKECSGSVPLHEAAFYGFVDIISVLVKEGADINAKDVCCNSPLHIVVQNGRTDSVKKLVELGAKLNVQNQIGQTPLYLAALNKYEDIFNILIQAGAEPGIGDNSGITPLHLAVRMTPEMVRLIGAHGASANCQTDKGFTPLMAACADGGDVRIVKELVALSADINAKDENKMTPLHFCSGHLYAGLWHSTVSKDSESDWEVISLLLRLGANINARNSDGKTPLFIAVETGRYPTLERLLEAGANIEQVSKDSVTPLMAACRESHSNVIRTLIEAGADIRRSCNNGWTALHYASIGGDSNIINALMKAGALVNARSYSGVTALHLASLNPNVVVSALVDPLFPTPEQEPANLEAVDVFNRTPLHWAAFFGNNRNAQLLIRWGADINPRDVNGELPIEMGCKCLANGSDGLRMPDLTLGTNGREDKKVEFPNGCLVSLHRSSLLNFRCITDDMQKMMDT